MTRVLLTGAGGFIGHHLLEHLMVNTDWEVVATDSFRHKGKFDRIREVTEGHPDWRERIKVITHDLTAPFTPQTLHEIGECDYVVAMASQSHVDRSIEDPVPFIKNNVDVILNTLDYCLWAIPSKIVVVSTDEVYGPEYDMVAHGEWDAVIPSNPYSASKACQEAIAISYWRSYGLPIIITNTMNVIGERQDPEKFLPMVIKNVAAGDPTTIHGTENDIGTRYYLHARNAADAWLYILNNVTPDQHVDGAPRPLRFNVVGDKRLSNLELAELVAAHQGKKLGYVLQDFHSARPGHDAHYGLDGNRLWFHGWVAPLDFEASLARTIDWTLAHPEWLL